MEQIILLNDFPDVPLLFGTRNSNIKLMRQKFGVDILARDNLIITGNKEDVDHIEKIVDALKREILKKKNINQDDIEKIILSFVPQESLKKERGDNFPIAPRTPGQKGYLNAIRHNDIVFAIGPAGTGKTFLAVAMALEALNKNIVRKLILVRPAVEAGEKLGFLPGDLQAKINPYLRPLYDSLYDLGGYERIKRYMDKNIIEIAPLAYMRGRTLENAFIILDESQNTTSIQMRMFLTRMGMYSKIVVTGDQTQIDLPPGQVSGLVEARKVLQNIKGLEFVYLTKSDIVRHKLVQKIVEAYEKES